jgi:hypothetical protein
MRNVMYLCFIICTSLFACKKNEPQNYTEVNVTIIKSVCNSSVLQITDAQYQYLGDLTYTDNGISYPGAFYTDALLAKDCAVFLNTTNSGSNQNNFKLKVSTTRPTSSVNTCFDRVFCSAIVNNPPKVTLYTW